MFFLAKIFTAKWPCFSDFESVICFIPSHNARAKDADVITTAHSELRAGINIWIKDSIFSYHLLQRKLNFIASPQLYAALNSYTSLMGGRGEVSLFSGIHSACVACVYNCVVRITANTVDVYCTCYSKYYGWAAHNTVVNIGNTGRMNAAEQTHLTSSNH